MKILFLCGSAEPGKDGVGDYTRRLCGELNRTGHQAQILSLCDKQVTGFITQTQLIEKTAVTVRRIPIASPYKQRVAWSQEVLKEETPDWVSLQFVPFSYDPKGLPLWLSGFLKEVKGSYKWHLMFHELWVGMNKEASMKLKVWGQVQKLIIIIIIRKVKFNLIQTQSSYYQLQLKNLGFSVDLLALFSNIPVVIDVAKELTNKDLNIAVFGGIYPGAPIVEFAMELEQYGIEHSLNISVSFIGRCGKEQEEWATILRKNGISVLVKGEQSARVISELLSVSNIGIVNTPFTLVEKSGVYAALQAHDLRVICLSHAWTSRKFFKKKKMVIDFQYMPGNLAELLNIDLTESTSNSLISVANSFQKKLY
jgi:hypothetical protein